MAEPEIALAFTPEPWVQELHRHCTDHGGARIRQIVMDASLVLEDEYDGLVASHRWPPLTRGLVDDVHARGRVVVGVYDTDEPEGCAFLESLGVDATVASEAAPSELVAVVAMLRPQRAHAAERRDDEFRSIGKRARLYVVGGPAGCGRTEIAIGLGARFAALQQRTILVDCDDVAPSVAVRLAIPLDPNLRDLIDASEHGSDIETVVRGEAGTFGVVAGTSARLHSARVRPAEVARAVERLRQRCDVVVADTAATLDDAGTGGRSAPALARRLLGDAETIVAVTLPTPVGVVRLLSWLAEARDLADGVTLEIVVNRAPRDAFRRRELLSELVRSHHDARVTFVPDDDRVGVAAWAGRRVRRGPFVRSLGDLASALAQPRVADGTRRGPRRDMVRSERVAS